MDIDTVDPISLDVAHRVDKVSFRFYSHTEALRISVRRLTSPHAFDELGRPISRGLYDRALGPTSYTDGPCVTCGLTYNSCPGHFGHIELPFPVPNPLLNNTVMKIFRSSCHSCSSLTIPDRDLNLLLASLYFEDASLPTSAFAIESYRFLRTRVDLSSSKSPDADSIETVKYRNKLVKNWSEFLRTMPAPVAKYMNGIDIYDEDLVEKNLLRASRNAWKEACAAGRLAESRSSGWKRTESQILRGHSKKCPRCSISLTKIRKGDRGRLFRKTLKGETLVPPIEIEAQVKAIWKQHRELFELLYGLKGRESVPGEESPGHMRLFVGVALVPPSRFRPTSIVGSMTYAAEHPQNMFFQRLLTEIGVIMMVNEYGLKEEQPQDASEEDGPVIKRPTKARFAQAMSGIQEALRDLYDSSGMTARSGTLQMTGIRQQLEAKAGLFRQHMMGKRVNHSCRSVIGPDVFLDTNEIGIPESFARLLTIPESVTPRNLEQMRQAVINGPDVYPGAVAVEDWSSSGEHRIVKFRTSGNKRLLTSQAELLMQNRMTRTTNNSSSQSLGSVHDEEFTDDVAHPQTGYIPKRVHRHLKTGDVVLFNRQPTLHRVSIMAHRVRVLPGDRTIRFHYANCGSYNADFDGDEMNVHVPQDPIARAEAEELMLSSKHYIAPTSGAPIRGLIQDHIAASTLLSRREMFFDRADFAQLLYSATERIMLRPGMAGKRYQIPEPAIMKPRQLWTGKQLISSVLSVIRNGRPGLNLEGSSRTKAKIIGKHESKIIIRNGELLQGCIDKSSLGASEYGIVHAIQEVYGCDSSDDFLSCIGRLCLFFLRSHGHTTGIEDLLLEESGDEARTAILRSSIDKIGVDVTNAVYAQMNQVDKGKVRKASNKEESRELVEEMIKKDGIEAEDRLDAAMNSALSKVSSEVIRACVPAALQKPFPSNGFSLMTSTGAKGSAVNAAQISCLLGSTVLEGKRVPRMGGSGATLPCFDPYDPSPVAGGFITSRFLSGISPAEFFFHAMSGREGLLDTSLKTANSGYLQRCLVKHLEGTRLHYDGSVRDSNNEVLQFIYGDDGIDPSKAKWLSEKIDWQISNKKCLSLESSQSEPIADKIQYSLPSNSLGTGTTLLEKLSPGALRKLGAISEKFDKAIVDAMARHTNGKELRGFFENRYRRSTVQPGEAVGVLAAQGVGEPSTQMTLNTFHHAGSSSAHVTLGIPRLRELLMTASRYPKTPSMTLPLIGIDQERAASELRKRLQNVRMLDLVLEIEVREDGISFLSGVSDWAARRVNLKIHLPPEKLYRGHLGLDFESIKGMIKNEFLPTLHNRFKKEVTRLVKEGDKKTSSGLRVYLRIAEKPQSVDLIETEASFEDGDDQVDNGDIRGNDSQGANQEDNNYCASSSDEEYDDDNDSNAYQRNEKAEEELMHVDKQEATDMDPDFSSIVNKANQPLESREGTFSHEENQASINGQKAPAHATGPVAEKEARISLPVEDDGRLLMHFGSLGYVEGSLRDHSKKTIEFEWSFPAVLIGKMSISEVMREAAGAVKLAYVPKIERCFLDSANGKFSVVTEGSNLRDIFEKGFGLVDFNHLETNDMFGILQTYGVEALRESLIKEFAKVFEAYGVPVNIRHLALIADYMTSHGSYRGFNRQCMGDTPSAFQRMTFETSVNFLTEAALTGTEDHMKNPSAALALGRVYQGGTGGFQLLHQSPTGIKA